MAVSPYFENAGCTAPDGTFYAWTPTQFAKLSTALIVAEVIAAQVKQKVDIVDTNAGMQYFTPSCPCYQVRLIRGSMFNAGLLFKAMAAGDPHKSDALAEVVHMKDYSQPFNFFYPVIMSVVASADPPVISVEHNSTPASSV